METKRMENEVVLTFKNGRKIRTILSAPFRPEENVVSVFWSATEKRTISFDHLCCVSIAGSRSSETENLSEGFIEEVKFVTGESFMLRIEPDQVFNNGFFGISADKSTPIERLFVISSAVSEKGNLAMEQPKNAATIQKEKAPEVAEKTGTGREPHSPEKEPQIVSSCQREQLCHLPHQNARVGDILVNEGLVTREQVENALELGHKDKIGTILIERGFISEEQLLKALAAKFGSRFIDLSEIIPSPEALTALPKKIVNQMHVLPLELQGKRLVVATSEPTDHAISDSLRFITNYHIELVVAVSRQISTAIEKFYNTPKESLDSFINEMNDEQPVLIEQTEDEECVEPDSKVILLVNKILIEAFHKNVSDIHFEPKFNKGPLIVRYRVDGECVLCHEIPPVHKNAIVSRLKIMAQLDIAERRKPQSGKIFLEYEKRRIEYRLEITPTVGDQEDAVLRLLTSAKPLSLKEMGFSPGNLANFGEMLKKPYGIILCVGPTGSGKTTTLHSALAAINTLERKIWTAEDPVEIIQDGLRQVQVNQKIGFSFEKALRSFLRADPDVIMIGEMRDVETTKTAIAASLTGHLVFSTLHTNSAPETVGRLIEMGLDPYNFADALLGIMAQRLTRKLCDQCKVSYQPSREEYEDLVVHYSGKWFREHGLPDYSDSLRLMKKTGCEMCVGTGYRGRIALHELLVGSPAVNRSIKKNVSVEDLRELAMKEGLRTLKMDGIQKVFQGITDLQQILKVCIL